MVLQARQRIKTDDEEQTFILSGICRVEDITPDNSILSTQMFDKELTKTHKGAVRDTTKRGWIPKLLDVINPF
jgi:flagellar L-ring protein precursor FlgH